jgi:hypothetical protein
MARELLVLLALAAPLTACDDPRQAEFEAAIQGCGDTYPEQIGTMVARVSCLHQQRDRYGVRLPGESLVRAIEISYATMVDDKQISLADATLAEQQQIRAVEQEGARTAAILISADAAGSSARAEQQAVSPLRPGPAR